MLLTLPFTRLCFFGLDEFRRFHWVDCYLRVITVNPTLVTSDNLGQESYIVAQNLRHTHRLFVAAIAKSHQARYTTPNKRT
jgi:hypothetical protein